MRVPGIKPPKPDLADLIAARQRELQSFMPERKEFFDGSTPMRDLDQVRWFVTVLVFAIIGLVYILS